MKNLSGNFTLESCIKFVVEGYRICYQVVIMFEMSLFSYIVYNVITRGYLCSENVFNRIDK